MAQPMYIRNRSKLLEILGAGGICLAGLALLDVAIAGLKQATEITNLWKSCGIIGGVLLAAYLVLGVFERESYLRQAIRGSSSWAATRLRRRSKTEPSAERAEAEETLTTEELQPQQTHSSPPCVVEDIDYPDAFDRSAGGSGSLAKSYAK